MGRWCWRGARRQGCGRTCGRGSRDAAAYRSWTIEANDKVIATAGLLFGFAGAGASNRLLLFTAAAATIAGGLSVGGASWAEEAADRDALLLHAKQERDDLAADPQAELEELTVTGRSGASAPILPRRSPVITYFAPVDVEPWAILAAACSPWRCRRRWQHALGS